MDTPSTPDAAPTPWHLRALQKAAAGIERITTPVARRALDKLHDANYARAMQDPAYAAIEAKRHIEGRDDDALIMIDDEAGLGMAEWEGQQRIWSEVAVIPWWADTATKLVNKPFTAAADTATWSLDTYLCQHTAALLDHLADTAHGWPQGDQFPTFEDWQTALRDNAAKLRHFADTQYELEGDDWEAARDDASAAFRWVGAQLGHLWD